MRSSTDTPAWNSRQNALMWQLYLGPDRTAVVAARDTGAPDYSAPGVGHELCGLPPALVVTAEIDPLRDEGLDYAIRLQRSGVSVQLHAYAGTFHVFDFAAPRADVSIRAVADQVAFLGRHLA
jgi:acetyl esterase/lipase